MKHNRLYVSAVLFLRSMPPNFHLTLQYFKNENPSMYLFQEWKSLIEIESEYTEFKTMEGYFLSGGYFFQADS